MPAVAATGPAPAFGSRMIAPADCWVPPHI
jgi:hypothetical protein